MRHKVLLMARELGLGGTERQLAEIALALDRERFEPHVGCFTDGGFRAGELREAGVPILELGVRSLVSRSAVAGARRMGAYLERHGVGLVHAFDVPLDLFAVPVARWYRTPVVLSSMRAHRDLTPGVTRHLLRLTDRIVDGIVVNSRAVARELAEQDGVPTSMVRLAYNGLDTRVFRREGERAALPWGEAAAVIGTVCALRPEKGLRTLMAAFRKVRAAHTGVKLVIVGSGPMLAELEAGGDGDCHFQPAERNVAPWLRAMDIFVLPSLSEALSNSLMEAMGCGCCPVASDTGGNPELVADGETGLLFPVGDAEALAERLVRLLDGPEYRRRLGARAERRIEEHFTREQAARTMGEIYEEFLGR
ncbi:MAG: glycosyltransferase family 4 protein [Candidatus Solibacter sp.]|nr:glycosyltransferase family 4 protein [Candidatus Solibacter sp.]